MGWKIQVKKEKYRIYSTVVDKYISKFMTKDELISFLFWHKFEKFIQNILEDDITFPNGWTNKETEKRMFCDKGKHDEFYNLIKDRKLMYNKFFNRMKDLGISISLKNDKNINLHN